MQERPSDHMQKLMAQMRLPAQPKAPQPVQVNSPKGCVIILGGSPSVVVKQAGS